MRDRTVLVGFGVTGASAARLLLATGVPAHDLTAVDTSTDAVDEATTMGATAYEGDATERATLDRAVCARTRCFIVTIGPDESAIMATMLARDLCPEAMVVTAVRDPDHVARAVRAGADRAYATPDWTGRALAMAVGLRRSVAEPAPRPAAG